MLDHISIGVSNIQQSRRFYDTALRPLGLVRIVDFGARGSDTALHLGPSGSNLRSHANAMCELQSQAPISASAHPAARRCRNSIQLRFSPAGWTTVRRGSDRNITPITMPRSYSTPTVTASRLFVTPRMHRWRSTRDNEQMLVTIGPYTALLTKPMSTLGH
jgi:hypothetical protein